MQGPRARATRVGAATLWGAAGALALFACSDAPNNQASNGAQGAGQSGAAGMSDALPIAGASGATGSAAGTGITGGSGATANTGGAGAGAGGRAGGSGTVSAGSGGGAAGTQMTAGGSGGSAEPVEPGPIDYELDCGPSGEVMEGHGPPSNRVNYIIVGDGYAQNELDTLYLEHVRKMLAPRFSPEFEPYARYRNFVNICALKVPSMQSGITMQRGNTAFDGYGNDQSRLGYVNNQKVSAKIEELLPAEVEVDWTAVVLNDSSWWNAGGRIMVWSGGHKDAALAAEHEGGHGFQILADEYGGNCTYSGTEARMRVNVTMDRTNTADKWKKWLDFNHTPGTGMQGAFEGAEYCDRGAFRPSDESVMNMLWDSSYFNAISRENAVRVIYDMIDPIDSSTPASTTAPQVLEVKVIDPAVLKVDWSVDGAVVAANAGATFDVAARGLSAGSHDISARVYDDIDWVRGDRAELEQTVQWKIQVP
jgi:hypothetical protein